MRRMLLAVVLSSALSSVVATATAAPLAPLAPLAPPPNDALASPHVIAGLPFGHRQNTREATTDAGEIPTPCFPTGVRSVWFRYTPPADQLVRIDTRGSNFSHVVSVWLGAEGAVQPARCEPSTELDNNDHVARLAFLTGRGQSYFIKVDAARDGGDLTLFVGAVDDRPMNDHLAAAAAITALPFRDTAAAEWATREAGERPDACGGDGDHGLWYRYTPASDGVLRLAASNQNTTVILSVWVGARHPLQEVACRSMYPASESPPFAVPVVGGSTYAFRVQPYGATPYVDSFPIVFDASLPPSPPPNDTLAGAIDVPELPAIVEADGREASREPDEAAPSCAPQAGGSLWYRFAAPRGHRLRIRAADDGPLVASVWRGTSHPLLEVACTTHAPVVVAVEPGATIWIQLAQEAPFVTRAAPLRLSVSEAAPTPDNDDLGRAIPIAALPFADTSILSGATAESGEVSASCELSGGPPRGIWYRYTPAVSHRLRLWAEGEIGRPFVSAWQGDAHPLTELACRAGPMAGAALALTVGVQAGQSYLIRVSDDTGSETPATLHAALPPPGPPHDRLADAREIARLPFADDVDTTEATTEPGERAGSCASGPVDRHGVWYRLRADADARIEVGIEDPDFATVVSVWTGEGDGLTEVACLEGRPGMIGWLAVAAGTSYAIKLESRFEHGGHVRLRFGPAQPIPPPPPNDALADATPILQLPFIRFGDTTGATAEPGDEAGACAPWDARRSVWYRWTADVDGRFPIRAEGVGYDPILTVWEGAAPALAPIACAIGPSEPPLLVPMTAGQTYWIRVEGYAESRGPYRLQVDPPLPPLPPRRPPANDDLANAIPESDLGSTELRFDTSDATYEPLEVVPSCGSVFPDPRSAWIRLSPSVGGRLRIRLEETSFPPIVSVWTGAAHPLTEMRCFFAAPSTTATVDLEAGEHYFLKVEGYSGSGGLVAVHLGPYDPLPLLAPNDSLAGARPIDALPFSETFDASRATTEPGEAASDCASADRAGHGLWWRYDAPADGHVRLTASGTADDGTSFGPHLSAWLGDGHPLRHVACRAGGGDGAATPLTLAVRAGQVYRIKIESPIDRTGDVTLTAAPVPDRPPNDDLAGAARIPALPFSHDADLAEATTERFEEQPSCYPYGVTRSVWYRFEPPRSGRFVLSSPEPAANVSVWVGDAHPLQEVACREALGPDIYSRLEVPLDSGTVYFIRIGRPLTDGPTLIRWSIAARPGPPPNDDWTAAAPIERLPFTDQSAPNFATWEPGEARGACPVGQPGVWYRYTPAADGRIRLDTIGSEGGNGFLSVWTGTAHPLREVACRGYVNGGGSIGSLTIDVEGGRTYFVRAVLDFAWHSDSDVLVVNVDVAPLPPMMDDLANAVPITGLPFQNVVDLDEATLEAEERPASCDNGTGSVWHRYAAAADGPVVVSTFGSGVGAIVSVWTGTGHPLTEVACQWGEARFEASVGTVYFVRLQPSSGGLGTTVLRVHAPLPRATNDDLAAATVVDRLPFKDAVDVSRAGKELREAASPCDTGARRGIWYRVVVAEPTLVRAETRGSNGPVALALWTGSSHPLRHEDCRLADGGGGWSVLTFRAAAGVTYLVRAEGGTDSTSDVRIAFERLPDPDSEVRVFLPFARRAPPR